jgi:hypothetical protein
MVGRKGEEEGWCCMSSGGPLCATCCAEPRGAVSARWQGQNSSPSCHKIPGSKFSAFLDA